MLSVGALLENEDLIALAKQNGGQIVVPTGALIGLDAVTAAAEGKIQSVRMVTRKPLNGLAGAPYLVENNIDIAGITEPLKIFEGTARDAAKGFPANLNVAVALSLAGLGPDRTTLQIWADPTVTRNVHRVEVESDSARFSMSIENIPSENPKTGRITALSVIAYLRKLRPRFASGPEETCIAAPPKQGTHNVDDCDFSDTFQQAINASNIMDCDRLWVPALRGDDGVVRFMPTGPTGFGIVTRTSRS